jgi:hypothetical protein
MTRDNDTFRYREKAHRKDSICSRGCQRWRKVQLPECPKDLRSRGQRLHQQHHQFLESKKKKILKC